MHRYRERQPTPVPRTVTARCRSGTLRGAGEVGPSVALARAFEGNPTGALSQRTL